ncbi:MAG: hypothetical protein AAB966_04135 [Patescibacteria group bacterium]
MSLSAEARAGQLPIPRSILLGRFWEGVVAGKMPEPNMARTRQVVARQYFAEPPLATFTGTDEQRLFNHLSHTIDEELTYSRSMGLCENPVVFIAPSEAQNDGLSYTPYFLTGTYADHAVRSGNNPLSVEQKIRLYTDPNIWEFARVKHGTPSNSSFDISAVGYGSRSFFDGVKYKDSYRISTKEFAEVVKNVRQSTGRENLRMCDVGGLTGLACHDVQPHYPDFEYTNITLDEEPGRWPGINHVFVPAERMPRRFFESFDIMVSNMAWRYFMFPDIALSNLVQALSLGGYADISYSVYSNPLDSDEAFRRFYQGIEMLEELQDKGLISFIQSPFAVGSSLQIWKHQSFKM